MIQTTDTFDIGSILEDNRGNKYTVIGLTGDYTEEIRAFYYYPIMYSVEVAKAGVKLDVNFLQNRDTEKAFSPAYLDGTTLIDDTRGVLDYLTGKIAKNKFIQQRLNLIYNEPMEQYFAYSVKRNKIEFVHYGNDLTYSLYHVVGKGTVKKPPRDIFVPCRDVKYFLDNVQYSKEVKDVYDFADYLEKLRFTTKKNTLNAIIKAYLLPLYTYFGYRAYGITDEEEIIKRVIEEYHGD